VRILVTNDDGVHAPGLAALTRALAAWAAHGSDLDEREVTVVAPLANHSGASAAVGTVFERESLPYRAAR
jgi:5'-nucleotidase